MVDDSKMMIEGRLLQVNDNILFRIISYLPSYDIVRFSKTCKKAQENSSKKEMGSIWWRLCIYKWYDPEQVPKIMPAKKSDWKKLYFTVGMSENELASCDTKIERTISRKKRLEQQKIQAQMEKDREVPPPTKDEMRASYKLIRSKPKGKRPERSKREFSTE
eukprot:TRINITY_DN6098_c0_g1_i5.p1 TRINITY_DN6098_c0_g1~~TRINITY_DN6098_c0_g1_i5.p1  ORF type:complete len:162 (-),score=35.77 TRINITY_DN6098_c0_g1_i5:89-574(-)